MTREITVASATPAADQHTSVTRSSNHTGAATGIRCGAGGSRDSNQAALIKKGTNAPIESRRVRFTFDGTRAARAHTVRTNASWTARPASRDGCIMNAKAVHTVSRLA